MALLVWVFEAIPEIAEECADHLADDVLPQFLQWMPKKTLFDFKRKKFFQHEHLCLITLISTPQETQTDYLTWSRPYSDAEPGSSVGPSLRRQPRKNTPTGLRRSTKIRAGETSTSRPHPQAQVIESTNSAESRSDSSENVSSEADDSGDTSGGTSPVSEEMGGLENSGSR